MYQLMFGLITIPAAALPLTPHHLSLSSLPTYLEAANKCFFGYNVMKTDQCSGDGLPVIVFMFFIIFNVTYNQVRMACCAVPRFRRFAQVSRPVSHVVSCCSFCGGAQLMLYVFKRGSSVLFVIASAVRLPLVDLLLLSTFIAGRAHERFTSTSAHRATCWQPRVPRAPDLPAVLCSACCLTYVRWGRLCLTRSLRRLRAVRACGTMSRVQLSLVCAHSPTLEPTLTLAHVRLFLGLAIDGDRGVLL